MPATSAATRRHVHEGEREADPQSPYRGKWNGDGIHDWVALRAVCARDGYTIAAVRQDPATGARRATIRRGFIDPTTGIAVFGEIQKTTYPKDMATEQIDELGEQAFLTAQAAAAGTRWRPFGERTRADGAAADGYFRATVLDRRGRAIDVEGWFREAESGDRTITSHAPRFERPSPWLPLDPSDW